MNILENKCNQTKKDFKDIRYLVHNCIYLISIFPDSHMTEDHWRELLEAFFAYSVHYKRFEKNILPHVLNLQPFSSSSSNVKADVLFKMAQTSLKQNKYLESEEIARRRMEMRDDEEVVLFYFRLVWVILFSFVYGGSL